MKRAGQTAKPRIRRTRRTHRTKKLDLIGMGMTEKQGGSDVRSNTTVATPVYKPGRGEAYLLRGHNGFFGPMCDAFTWWYCRPTADALACFFVPRWKPDGIKNTHPHTTPALRIRWATKQFPAAKWSLRTRGAC